TRLQQEPRSLCVHASLRARGGRDEPAGCLCHILPRHRTRLRNQARHRERGHGREIEGGPPANDHSARDSLARPIHVPDHGARPVDTKGVLLADAHQNRPLILERQYGQFKQYWETQKTIQVYSYNLTPPRVRSFPQGLRLEGRQLHKFGLPRCFLTISAKTEDCRSSTTRCL